MFTLTPERWGLPEGQDCELNVLLRAEVSPSVLPPYRPSAELVFILERGGGLGAARFDMAHLAISAFRGALQESDRFSLVTVEGDSGLREAWQGAWRQLRQSEKAIRRIVIVRSPRGGWEPAVKEPFCELVAGARRQGVVTSAMGFLQERRSLAEDLAEVGGGNYYRLEQRSPFDLLARLELSGLVLCPVSELKVTVECPDEVELEWITRSFRWEPLDCYRPVQKLIRLKIPAGHQGALLRATFAWTQDGERVVQECPLELERLPADAWARLDREREVEAQILRHEFLRLVFGYTRWWDAENQSMRIRLSEVLEAEVLPLQERKAMRMIADMSPRKTILDDDIADRLNGFFDVFFSKPVWAPRLHDPREDELDEEQLYRIRGGLRGGFDPTIPARSWQRVEGMLVGLFQGAGSRQTAATLAYLATPGLRPCDAFGDWQARYVMQPSPHFARLLRSLDSDECGPLRRVAAGLLPHCRKPHLDRMWCEIAGFALLSDPTPEVLAACYGVAHLLWEALALPAPPEPEWYRETFLAYPAFQPQTVHWLETRDFSWLSGRGEGGAKGVVIAWLHLLEQYGSDPTRALNLAMNSPDLAALTGAALGAIHGVQPDWETEEELKKLVERIRQQWF